MLPCTFIHLPRIGRKREEMLWKQGILRWEQLERDERVNDDIKHALMMSRQAFLKEDWAWFASMLGREAWRIIPHEERVVYVDIESYGIAKKRATLIALHDGVHTRIVSRLTVNKREVQWVLNRARLIVTFHGGSYDLPILREEGFRLDHLIHIPAESLFARIGWKGTLREVEERIGIERPERLHLKNGKPLRLWKRWLASGDEQWYEQLKAYVTCDVESLAEGVRRAIHAFRKLYHLPACSV